MNKTKYMQGLEARRVKRLHQQGWTRWKESRGITSPKPKLAPLKVLRVVITDEDGKEVFASRCPRGKLVELATFASELFDSWDSPCPSPGGGV